MKLFNAFAEPGYHTSIITTFGVDFDAYESIALPRLREAGCNNNILIADARMLAHSMNDEFRRPHFAGRRYSVVGVQSKGAFHPKLILQLGRTSGRLLVTSANMTAPGLAGNLEVVGEVSSGEGDRQFVPILRAALEYLSQFLVDTSVPRRQVDWAMRRTRWLADSPPSAPYVRFEDGEALAFLASCHERSIADRFVELVAGRKVRRLVAVSPYWDSDLKALRQLKAELLPKKTSVLVQSGSALFPVHRWPIGRGASLFDANIVKGAGRSRFAHAKLIIAETATGDCVLYGSANCTTAALGEDGKPGVNEEACLFRELSPGQAVKDLGMEAALSDANAIDASSLPAFKPGEDIPLSDLASHLPGRFELAGTILRWWPQQGVDYTEAQVQLYDQVGSPLSVHLRRVGIDSGPVTFDCLVQEPPHFAQVRASDFESSFAIILVEQALQEAQRRSKSKSVENALALLDDDEAFEGLWLLQVIQKLDDAERKADSPPEAKRIRSVKGVGASDASRKLSYEEFIACRKPVAGIGPMGSHLASSHQESVRGFLNALIGRRQATPFDGYDSEAIPSLSLGDETNDGETALDSDERFYTDAQLDASVAAAKDKQLRRRQQYVKDTQASIASAVEAYIGHTQSEATRRSLGVVDLLRLRALLLVILGAGSKRVNLLSCKVDVNVSRRQVLPIDGDASWRWLVGRLLFTFFRDSSGYHRPLVDKVALDLDASDGLPEDVLECWATCFWALCAARVAVNDRGEPVEISQSEHRIAVDLYRRTMLLPEETMGEAMQGVFFGMATRYGERLGVEGEALRKEHARLVSSPDKANEFRALK